MGGGGGGGGGYDGGGTSVLWGEVLLSEEEALAVWHKLETMEVVIVKVMVKMVT